MFFDELLVTHEHSAVVAGADYYPFGLAMDGRKITDEPYRWGYQGQYAQKNDSTGWNEFQLRMYDARFGRWLSTDPYGQFASPYVGMGNAPNLLNDPTGGFTGGTTILNEVLVTASRLPSIAGTIGSIVGSVGRSLTTVGFANGACPKCPDPEWAELKKGQSITFEDGTEYILDDPSLGRDGWIRNGGTMEEVVVTPSKSVGASLRRFLSGVIDPAVDVGSTMVTTTRNGPAKHFQGKGYAEWMSWRVDEDGFYKYVDQYGASMNNGSTERLKELMVNTTKVNTDIYMLAVPDLPVSYSNPWVQQIGDEMVKTYVSDKVSDVIVNALGVH